MTRTQLQTLRRADPEPNRVAVARRLAGLTQEDLAARMGWTQSYLSKLERGAFESFDVLKAGRLAAELGCETSDLFPVSVEAR